MANPFADLRMQLPINYNDASTQVRRMAREQYAREQNGNCYHCKQPLTSSPSLKIQNTSIDERLFPPGFFNNPVHLHHDHVTGMTIGAVHARCNAYLWQYHQE